MSKEPWYTQKIIQPCITSLLSPSAELVVSQTNTNDSVEAPFESVKHKKIKQSKKSSEQSGNNLFKRSMKKNPEKMSTNNPSEDTMPLDKAQCKKLGYTVQNYNHQGWIDSIEALCRNSIRAKFEQNPASLRALMNIGDKIIIESSKDDIWGTGIPLFRWDCLQEKLWTSRGKLGTILMEI